MGPTGILMSHDGQFSNQFSFAQEKAWSQGFYFKLLILLSHGC